jgi:putative Mg2+ transporter-C (MgtC) family protein
MAFGTSFYFTEFTVSKGIFYLLATLYVISVGIVCVAELFMDHDCEETYDIKYANPTYVGTPCRHTRYPFLLYLTPEECAFGRRIVMSVLLGGIIGWERRQADRPAGIRTMSLVSLGSCLFTICSTFAFLDGPMAWDASRVSAAIPSGVGFLGAGLIFKENEKDDETGDTTHVVHGLTTAASLWLSAAVGVACGGEMYFVASFSIAVMLMLLRFGPRLYTDYESMTGDVEQGHYSSMSIKVSNSADGVSPERQSMLRRGSEQSTRSKTTRSIRQRPHLGGLV